MIVIKKLPIVKAYIGQTIPESFGRWSSYRQTPIITPCNIQVRRKTTAKTPTQKIEKVNLIQTLQFGFRQLMAKFSITLLHKCVDISLIQQPIVVCEIIPQEKSRSVKSPDCCCQFWFLKGITTGSCKTMYSRDILFNSMNN